MDRICSPLRLSAVLVAALLGGCASSNPTCSDGARNGDETDVDCGGRTCGPCADAKACAAAGDCSGGLCRAGLCATPTCTDKLIDQDETDVDCGGACPACALGQMCRVLHDCAAGVCLNGVCAPASCADGLRNGDESDLDCGGACPPCKPGKGCARAADCDSGVCTAGACVAPGCRDQVPNGDETDVDCGGSCPACPTGRMCKVARDCGAGVCLNSACAPAACVDGVKNGDETDVDCGGSCPACHPARVCGKPADCDSGVCEGGVCAAPTCMDLVKNGDETDVDCGGAGCAPCADLKGCVINKDCQSRSCQNATCAVPSCLDGVVNGDETDVDCGGKRCPPCGVGKVCGIGADCWDGDCQMMTCGSQQILSVGVGQSVPFDVNADGSRLVVLDNGGNVTVDRQASLASIARYLWVANSGEGTVSKIDPQSGKEVARYCTAPGCNADPSRVSVSLDGDAGVANRANYYYASVLHPERASATKIAGDRARCVDRNGNGQIDTFEGVGPVPAQFKWPANTQISPDECVLWNTPLVKDRNGNLVGGAGTLPRSASFDSRASSQGGLSSYFYVGLFGTSELAQIESATGLIKLQVAVGGQPYSSVFDPVGNLWIRDSATSRLIKVDTTVDNLPAVFVGPVSPCNYAITVDRRGYIYNAGATCVARLDPSAMVPSWEVLALPGACFPRGPSLDADYNLWVPDTCFGAFHVDASKAFGQGMTVKKAIPLPLGAGGQADSGYYLGSAIDGTGFPWIVGTQTNSLQQVNGPAGKLFRIDPANNYATTLTTVGTTPYVYSDLSGSQLALGAATRGSYRKTFQAYCGSRATWGSLKWSDVLPAQTSIQVRYRAAHDLASLASVGFTTVGSEPPVLAQPVPITLANGVDPSYLQVEFVVATSDAQSKPTLASVTVDYTCPK